MTRGIFLAVLLALLISTPFFINPAISLITKNIIERKIPGSHVSIGKCELKPNEINFLNVNIRQSNGFDLRIEQVRGYYSLLSILQQSIPVMAMKDLAFFYKKIKIENIQVLGWIKGQQYFFTLHFPGVNLNNMIDSFEVNEKLDWSGIVNGALVIGGNGQGIKTLHGTFLSDKNGGTVVIKDARFLENMAKNSKLPANLVVDSFKNYHYNSGKIFLFLERGDLILDVSLNGETGKRNLMFNIHDFSMK